MSIRPKRSRVNGQTISIIVHELYMYITTTTTTTQCKLLYARVVLGKDHQRKLQRVTTTNAGRVFALVAGIKTPPAQVAKSQGDRAPASIGASWNGMQQQRNLHMGTTTMHVSAHVQVACCIT